MHYTNTPDNKKVIIRNDINHLKANFEIAPLSIAGAEMFGVLKKKFKDSSIISKENIKNIISTSCLQVLQFVTVILWSVPIHYFHC